MIVPGGDALNASGASLSRRSALRLALGAASANAFGAIVVNGSAAASPAGGPPQTIWDATEFGVRADGRTDDSPAINALIVQVSAAGGGTVLLPPAVMDVHAPIEMASGVCLRGRGRSSVLRLAAEIPRSGVVQFGEVADIVIEDLKIEGRAESSDLNNGILGKIPGGYRNVVIRNIWVEGSNYGGISLLGSSDRSVISTDVTVIDCTVTNAGGQGIVAQWAVDRCRIQGCTVAGFSIKHPDCVGIAAGRFSYDVSVVDNHVEGSESKGASPHGISLDSVFGRALCSDNTVVDSVGFGIEVGFVTDGAFLRNTVRGGTRGGIMLTSIGASDERPYASNLRVLVAGNLVDGTRADGIAFYMGGALPEQECPAAGRVQRNTAYAASSQERVVDGRRLYECLTSGTTDPVKPEQWGRTRFGDTVTDGTTAWVDRGVTNASIEISDNEVRNVRDRGIHLNYAQDTQVLRNVVTASGLSGIHVAASSNLFTLQGNRIHGCNASQTVGDGGITVIAFTGSHHVVEIVANELDGNGIAEFVATDSKSGGRIDDRLLADSASPTVAFGREFITQNTTLTRVRRLTDPKAKDQPEVMVRVRDAMTTFVHSDSGPETLSLAGSSDFRAVDGAVVKFRWDESLQQWTVVNREIRLPS